MRTLTYAHTHHACAHTRRHTCVSTCSAPIKLKDYLGEPARLFHFLTFNCSKCPILMHFTPTPPPQVRTGRLGTQEALARPLLPEGGPRPRLRRHGLVVPVSASACAAPSFGRARRFGSSHPASCPERLAARHSVPCSMHISLTRASRERALFPALDFHACCCSGRFTRIDR